MPLSYNASGEAENKEEKNIETADRQAVSLEISPQGLYAVNTIDGTGASKIGEAARGNRTAGNTDNIALVKVLFLSRKLPKANNLKRKLKKSRLFGHRFRK